MISVSHGREFVRHVLPAVIRPLRIVWNQIIGFVFLVFAILAGFKGVRSIREFSGDPQSVFNLVLISVFFFLMAGFGVSSFWKAHKVSKGQ